MNPLMQAAANYALRGLAVFPCEKKKPLTANGFKDASDDAAQIAGWWERWPEAQVALPTGQRNHLLVVDVDGPEGQKAVERLGLPFTFTVQTQPGRFQLWYAQPDGFVGKCSAGQLGPQLDVRSDGGYVIAPPSIHHVSKKPYAVFREMPWTPAPENLLALVRADRNGQPAAPGKAVIAQGRRHQALLSMAGALRARNLEPEAILAALLAVNERECKPPLPVPEVEKLAQYVGSKPPGFPGQSSENSVEIETESFASVTPEEVRWLWHRRLPIGKLTIFAGDPGQGKSLVGVDIAARLSRGLAFPDGAPTERADTLILSAEDDASDTIRPRLDAAAADVAHVHRIKAVRVRLADGSTAESRFSLERDLERLENVLEKNPAVKMVQIDPLTAYTGRIDTHRDAEVRGLLGPLAELASRRGIAALAIMHLKKSETAALLRISGSIGFVAAARVVWGFGPDPQNSSTHVMVAVKNNLAPLGNGLAYEIAPAGSVARIVWLPDPVSLDANTVLNAPVENASRRREAEGWLRAYLERGVEMPAAQIFEAAEKQTFSERTLKDAKKALGIRTFKRGDRWFWART
jgi:hypothetical protein